MKIQVTYSAFALGIPLHCVDEYPLSLFHKVKNDTSFPHNGYSRFDFVLNNIIYIRKR